MHACLSGRPAVRRFTTAHAWRGRFCCWTTHTRTRPAYRLNSPVRVFEGVRALPAAPVTVDAPSVVIESVKPLHERAERALVVRLYECEGGWVKTGLHFADYIKSVEETDLLEENGAPIGGELTFTPFEIKTLILRY